MKKAQVGIETIFSAIILLLILTFAAVYTIFERNSNNEMKNALEVRANCYKFSNLVSEAFSSGAGIYISTNFLQNYTFTVFTKSKTLLVASDSTGANTICALPASRVTNTTGGIPGSFTLTHVSALNIRNTGGVVIVS